MPRQRSPDSKKAETLWRKGIKLTEIADMLGVPAGTVRRWKKEQKWELSGSKKRSETEQKTFGNRTLKPNAKPNVRKQGAQPGNVNAVGKECGALLRNKNAEKHGAYSRVYWDSLDKEEEEMCAGAPEDEEDILLEQILMCSIRERRIMRVIRKYMDMKDADGRDSAVTVSYTQRSEHARVFDGPPEEAAEEEREYKRQVREKIENKERMPGRDVAILTQEENIDDKILRLEKELSTVQSKKTAAVVALHQVRTDKEKLSGHGSNEELANAWIDGILGKDGGSGG